MLKTVKALVEMLKGQEEALLGEQIARQNRDDAMIKAIQDDAVAFQTQMEAMLANTRIAIRKLEGTEEVTHG